MIKKSLIACLLSISFVFSQTSNPQDNFGELQLSEEDLLLVQMLLTSDMFRDTFVQACTIESIEWLGAQWAEKTCSCAYDNLAKSKNLLLKFLKGDENSEEMDKMNFELLEVCLPNQFPAEMESAIIRECMTGGVKKSACDCVVKSIKKKYTVRSFMKDVFEKPNVLETEITNIATQCAL